MVVTVTFVNDTTQRPEIYNDRPDLSNYSLGLNADAPLTCQFMLEDHAIRHSYHHLAAIRGALKR